MSDIAPIKTLVTIEPITVASTTQNTSQTPNPLSTLSNGTMVEGFVVNRDTHNQPILRTSVGDVLVNTPLFLKTGTEVTIRVDNNQPGLARIITINGQSPETFAEIQRTQVAAQSSDSLSSQLASTVSSGSNAVPKPVLLQGMMLQLAPRESLPAPVADALFKALGIDKPLRQQTAPSVPLSIVLRSIAMPQTEGPQPPLPSPASHATIPAPQPASPAPANATVPPIPTASVPAGNEAAALSAPMQPQATPPKLQQITQIPTAATTPASPSTPAQTAVPTANPVTTPVGQTATSQPIAQPIPAAATPPSSPALPHSTMLTANETTASPAQTGLRQPPSLLPPAATPTATATQNILRPSPSIDIRPDQHVVVQGLVIGQEQKADTILHTPIGTMRIFTPKPLPNGAVVTVEVSNEKPVQQTGTASKAAYIQTVTEQESTESLLRDWQGMKDLVDTLVQADPALFQATLARILPAPGKHFTHAMMFFLSALKGGDMKQWLTNNGRIAEITDNKYTDLLRRLGAEFTVLQQTFNEPTPQQWISTAIPIFYENTLHQARLHVRQDNEISANSASHKGQRFIIDIELSRLGEMQIDGFVQKEPGKHQFDIMIRSSKHLPPEVENDIRDIYNNASEIAGFKGSLVFQPSREHFVIIQRPQAPQKQSGIIA